MKKRIKIPHDLENQLYYNSARTCCVCKEKNKPVVIHHMDENPSNNSYNNLIVLCHDCHDDAHTKRKLSSNLSISRLKVFKRKWEKEIKTKSSLAMLPYNNLSQAIWTFLNHDKIPYLLKSFNIGFKKYLFDSLKGKKCVDKNGVPILKKSVGRQSAKYVTIYDNYAWDDGHRLHQLYSEAVDSLILETNPIELGAIWSKNEIKDLVKPGSICFCMRGIFFKKNKIINYEEDRIAYARSRKIEIRFLANTRHMFGNSSLYDSFSGLKFTASLLLVKNIGNENGNLIINCTPIALGIGFLPSKYDSPRHLKYGWKRIA